MPLAVVELKNPADESADVWKAYSQLQTYKDEISDLLAYNVALVISDGITARVGSLTANKERFMLWNTIKNEDDRPLPEYQLEKVVHGLFGPELFLDYMRYFVCWKMMATRSTKRSPVTISSTESVKPSTSPPCDLT